MKKLLFFILFFCMLTLAYSQPIAKINTKAVDNLLAKIDYSSILNENKMLVFKNEPIFIYTTKVLEEAEELYNKEVTLVQKKANLDYSEVNFDENYVANYFLRKSMFSNSLRQEMILKETKVYQKEDFKISDLPSNKGIPLSFLQMVFNKNGEIKIGKEVSKIYADGGIVKIIDGNLKELKYLRSLNDCLKLKPTKTLKIENQVTINGANCRNNKQNHDVMTKNISGVYYKAWLEVGIFNFGSIHRTWAELKSRKKNCNFCIWKKHFTDIKVELKGNVLETEYINSTCPVYEYNEATGELEYVGEESCIVGIDCSKVKSVNLSGNSYNNELRVTFSNSTRIGVNSSGFITGIFQWMDLTKSVVLP